MKIACRCQSCGNIFMQEDDDLCLEFDFHDRKIRFICRNKNCKHENVLDFEDWQQKQKHSPLPSSFIGRM